MYIDFSQGLIDIQASPSIDGVLLDVWNSQLSENIDTILKNQKKLAFYQGYDSQLWSTSEQGIIRAQDGIHLLEHSDITPCLFLLDCEGASHISQNILEEWVKNWIETVSKAGYQTGVYVGPNFSVNWKNIPKPDITWKAVSLSVPTLFDDTEFYDIYQISNTSSYGTMSVDFDLVLFEKKIKFATPSTGTTTSNATATSTTHHIDSNTYIHTITVSQGDTLWKIAGGNWNKIREIRKLNNMGNSSLIRVGQLLTIP